jgi:predicted XRE-type DNA-binding protein
MAKLDDILTLPSGGRFVGLLPHLEAEIGKSFDNGVFKNYTFQIAAALDVNRPDCGYRIRGLTPRRIDPRTREWTLMLHIGRMVLDSSVSTDSGSAELAAGKLMQEMVNAIYEWEECHQKSLSALLDVQQCPISKVADRNIASNSKQANWHILNVIVEMKFIE